MKFEYNPLIEPKTEEQKWGQIRLWRNAELAATDWTQIADSSADKTAWAEYRQALRDLPNKFDLADNVDIPERP